MVKKVQRGVVTKAATSSPTPYANVTIEAVDMEKTFILAEPWATQNDKDRLYSSYPVVGVLTSETTLKLMSTSNGSSGVNWYWQVIEFY